MSGVIRLKRDVKGCQAILSIDSRSGVRRKADYIYRQDINGCQLFCVCIGHRLGNVETRNSFGSVMLTNQNARAN